MLQLSDFYSKYTTTPAIAQKRVEHGSVIPLRWKLYYPAVSNTDKHTASALEQQWQCNGPHAILDRCTLTCKLPQPCLSFQSEEMCIGNCQVIFR